MIHRHRAVICVDDPWRFIPDLQDYSIMIINPDSNSARLQYLLDRADWSLLITRDGQYHRNGSMVADEKVFWYTSGTTGDSKFCSFSQAQVDDMARRIVQSYDITTNDRYVSVMPLWHAHGQGFYWATSMAGCNTVFSSIKQIRDLEKYDPTFFTAIPDALKLIENFRLPSLRFIRSASAPMPPDLYQRLKQKFDVPIIEAFGMTEALSHCFTNPLYGVQKIGTVGLPDGIKACIDQGRLLIQGATVCSDGWYDTGDLAEVDEDGYYRIIGRSQEQINVRGIKINPSSLESQILDRFERIEQCTIFGQYRVKCVYVGECETDAVRDFLTQLGSHCRPDFVVRVESIPLSPSGKISRRWLLEHYSKG